VVADRAEIVDEKTAKGIQCRLAAPDAPNSHFDASLGSREAGRSRLGPVHFQ
jgi:hypothetical protein